MGQWHFGFLLLLQWESQCHLWFWQIVYTKTVWVLCCYKRQSDNSILCSEQLWLPFSFGALSTCFFSSEFSATMVKAKSRCIRFGFCKIFSTSSGTCHQFFQYYGCTTSSSKTDKKSKSRRIYLLRQNSHHRICLRTKSRPPTITSRWWVHWTSTLSRRKKTRMNCFSQLKWGVLVLRRSTTCFWACCRRAEPAKELNQLSVAELIHTKI